MERLDDMAAKHGTKGSLVSLEKAFVQLAEKMALKGRISEQNRMLHFWGRSKNGVGGIDQM